MPLVDADYGLRFHQLGQATIKVQNIGTDALNFVHTDDCEAGACVSRTSDWLDGGPPKVGDSIAAGDSAFVVGKLDTTFWWHEHVIFLAFSSRPSIIIAIRVATYGSGAVRVSLDRFEKESGHNGRAELASIDGATGTINIQIPAAPYWLAAKRANEAYDGSSDDGRNDIELAGRIIDTALGTLITTCFVIPGWQAGAVGLTLLEGIIHLAMSSSATAQRATITQFKLLLDTTTKLFQQVHFNSLKSAMSTVTASFAEPNFGINRTFSDICQKLEGQADKTVLDDDTRRKIELCLGELAQVVDPDHPLMTALEECFTVLDDASNALESPSKARISMVFAAASMIMEAYALGTAVTAFVKTESSGWRINTTIGTPSVPLIDVFSPDRVLKWLRRTTDRIRAWKVEENAKSTRSGYVCIEMDSITERKAGIARLVVYDSALGLASWAPGTEKEVDDMLVPFGFKRDEPPWYEHVPSWTYKRPELSNSEKHKNSYDEAKRVGDTYRTYLDQLVHVEQVKFYVEPLATLEESGTPYFPHLTAPHPPPDTNRIPDVKIEESKTFATPTELKFRFVQYAYSFANNRGGESSLVWQKGFATISSRRELKDGKDMFVYPQGAVVDVPKDPWNAMAKAFAAKANAAAEARDPGHKLIPTPYSSSTRIVYRRLCTTSVEKELTETTSKVDRIWSLDNSSDDSFFDNWEEALKSLG